MDDLAVGGEAEDVIVGLTTAGPDTEHSVRVSVREEESVGLLPRHGGPEPGLAGGWSRQVDAGHVLQAGLGPGHRTALGDGEGPESERGLGDCGGLLRV